MKISATNHFSGEVIELDAETYEQIVEAWQIAQEYAKVAERLKDQLKQLVPKFVDDITGVSEPVNGYIFRVSNIQRTNYDKAIMRQVFDEDTLDLLLEPNKPAIDKYLREHLEDIGNGSTLLRKSMLPVGKPYAVIKLEKVSRGDVN